MYAALLSVLALAARPVVLFGQATATGTVEGTISDSSQALVVGAQVVIADAATGAKRTMVTNSAGSYRFDLLPAGRYSVTISNSGFSTVVENIELEVGRTASANATLAPGAATQTVEVTGSNPMVDVLKTSVSEEITPTEVQSLPMIGQDAANLAYLAPGVKFAGSYDPTKNRYAILSVNGDGGRNVNVTVNGVDNKDNTVGGTVMQLPLEAVEEFQISTQRFSAENGRSEGAAINMITKRGGNQFHGSAFGYFRDTSLNTDEKQADGLGGQVKAHPSYSRQQFGGSAGGPVKKDKAFLFFAIQRERESQSLQEAINSYTQLTAAKSFFPGDNPAATIPRPFYENRYNGRADWTFSSKESAYISYTSQANNSLNDQSDGTGDLNNGNFTVNHLQLANFTVNSILSDTTVNQFTFGFQYWNNLIASMISAPLVTFPSASFGTNTNVPQQSFQRKWQFKDDFSKAIGKHTFKGGVDYIWNPVEGGFFESNSTLEIDFGADPSAIIANKGGAYPQGFATAGAVTGMSNSNGNPYFLVPTKQLGFYFQDDWKTARRLTLNLGLRWDKDFNTFGESDIPKSRTYQELVALNNAFSNPYVKSVPHDDNKDFSPRVGFAYDVTGKGNHVVRGGFGLYFGNSFQNIPLFMEQQANATVFAQVLSLSNTTDLVPGAGKTLGQWRYGVDPFPTIPGPSTKLASGSVGRLIDPNYRNPVTEEVNAGYTWAVNQGTAVEVEYTHVLGLHGNRTINIDQKVPVNGVLTRPLDAAFAASSPAQPELASVRNEESIGREHYDGFNFSFRERAAARIQLEANYTLSWAYGYDTGASGGSFRNYPRLATAPFASYEWGPSSNDERHHITVSSVINLPKGFETGPILQYGSARPYNMVNSTNTLNTGGGTTNAVVVPTSSPTAWQTYLGSSGATAAQNCFYGINSVTQGCTIAKYDPLRGQPYFELDMRLAKSFRFGERMNLQIIAQAFNLTNRANYGNDYGSATLGTETANIAAGPNFNHPQGFIAPVNTTIPRSLWGEMGVHFTF
jgi:hypothetical protein